jgi:hypothetical protein
MTQTAALVPYRLIRVLLLYFFYHSFGQDFVAVSSLFPLSETTIFLDRRDYTNKARNLIICNNHVGGLIRKNHADSLSTVTTQLHM